MNRYACIVDGIVENVILWDGDTDYDPGPDVELVLLDDADTVGPGHTYDGHVFTPTDPEPAPTDATVPPDVLSTVKTELSKAKTITEVKAALGPLLEAL